MEILSSRQHKDYTIKVTHDHCPSSPRLRENIVCVFHLGVDSVTTNGITTHFNSTSMPNDAIYYNGIGINRMAQMCQRAGDMVYPLYCDENGAIIGNGPWEECSPHGRIGFVQVNRDVMFLRENKKRWSNNLRTKARHKALSEVHMFNMWIKRTFYRFHVWFDDVKIPHIDEGGFFNEKECATAGRKRIDEMIRETELAEKIKKPKEVILANCSQDDYVLLQVVVEGEHPGHPALSVTCREDVAIWLKNLVDK
jgi:hypothetical protein